MNSFSGKSSVTLALILAAFAALAPLLFILIKLLSAIFSHYDLYLTTGGESFPVYSIWKVQNGHPLYEWPNKGLYQLTLYNFLFYHVYGHALSHLGFINQDILLGGKLLTLCFAILGATSQFYIMVLLVGSCSKGCKIFFATISACVWLNSYFPGYYYLSVRPDIPAASLATLGVYYFAHYLLDHKRVGWLIFASVCFSTAWCFKQNAVAMLLGCLVYLLLSARIRALILVGGVFAAVVSAAIIFAGDIYRWNTLIAPTVNSVFLADAALMFLPAVAISLFFWTCMFSYPLLVSRHVSVKLGVVEFWRFAFRDRIVGPYTALMCIVIAGGGLSFVALGKTGSSLNHMFETLVAASSLSSVVVAKLSAFEKKWRFYQNLAAAVVALLCIMPIAQIALNRMGPITRVTNEEVSEKRQFRLFLQALPKPLLITDEIYALPWHSSDGSYPAVTIDPVYYYAAKERGLLEGGGLEQLVKNRFFASAILLHGDDLADVAVGAGYSVAASPLDNLVFSDAFNVPKTGKVLLRQPEISGNE